ASQRGGLLPDRIPAAHPRRRVATLAGDVGGGPPRRRAVGSGAGGGNEGRAPRRRTRRGPGRRAATGAVCRHGAGFVHDRGTGRGFVGPALVRGRGDSRPRPDEVAVAPGPRSRLLSLG